MRFPAGARLGPYEIDGIIPADAIGEAYRARNTRLTRPVALKIPPAVLPPTPIQNSFARVVERTVSRDNPPSTTLV